MKQGRKTLKQLGHKTGRRGPKPETVKIDEDWKEAVRKSLKKKKPKEGWPK
jgi:hypothetical protein